MLRLTDTLADATQVPGHANRTVRLKYVDVREMYEEYLASNARIGRRHCPVCDDLAQHLDDDPIETERRIYADPDWGPTVLCETIRNTVLFNNAGSHRFGEEIAEAVQHDMMLALIEHHPFARARGPFSEMLKHPRMRFVSWQAAFLALAYLNTGHPNPRRFLEKPEVRGKFPADLDLSAFRAPDFEPAARA